MRRMGAGSAGPLPDLSTLPATRGGCDIWFCPLINPPPSCRAGTKSFELDVPSSKLKQTIKGVQSNKRPCQEVF